MIFDETGKDLLGADGIAVIKAKYNEVFEKLDALAVNFQNGVVDSTPDEITNTLQVITGYYTALNTVSSCLEAYKVAKGGAKFLTKEERELCNLFEAYTKNSDRMITVCQTLRKRMFEEYKRTDM